MKWNQSPALQGEFANAQKVTTPGPESGTAPSPASTDWLLLARILRPQGRKGEVLAELLTDFPDRFTDHPEVFLAPPGFAGSLDRARSTRVTSFFLPLGKNRGRIVLAIEGIDSISKAETLAHLDVLVPVEDRLEPDEDASYISDLIGCAVYHVPTLVEGQPNSSRVLVGTIGDVHFATSPDGTRRLEDAAPLLSVLSPDGSEILIPYVKAYMLEQDLPGRTILMTLPEGLLEVNL